MSAQDTKKIGASLVLFVTLSSLRLKKGSTEGDMGYCGGIWGSVGMLPAKTLKKHKRGILAYDDYPISTGPLEEGTNHKIKTMKQRARVRRMNLFLSFSTGHPF